MADSKDKLFEAVIKGDLEVVGAMLKSFCLSSKARNKRSKFDYLTQQDKYNLFMKAVTNKHLEIVKYFISNGLNFANNQHFKSSSKTTPLHVAIENDDVEMLKLLLNNGADIRVIDSKERTPLILAAELNKIEVFKVILEQCTSKNVIDYEGIHGTALHEAIRNDNMEMIKSLLANNCHFGGFEEAIRLEKLSIIYCGIDHSPDSKERNIDDMLHLAISSGQINVVKYLLNTRAINLNKIDYNKRFPLETAISNSQKSMIDFLLERGADAKQSPVLTFAIAHKQTELLKMFLAMDTAEGNNFKSINNRGVPLLSIAAYVHYEKGVEILLSHGASVNETFTAYNTVNDTALHIAVEGKSVQIANILLSRGAFVNTKRESLHPHRMAGTPLHIAVRNGHFEMVKLLLEYKADVTIVSDSMTPLDWAAESGYQEIVELILNRGVFNDNSRRLEMSSAIIHAAENDNLQLIKLFLKEGAVLRTCEGIVINKPALHKAAEGGYLEIFKLVLTETLAQGGSIDDCDDQLLTAMHYVVSVPLGTSAISQKRNNDPTNDDKAREEIIDILLTKGADINAKNLIDMTPLHYSVYNIFNSKTAVLLIKKGADFNLEDIRGRNVFDHLSITNQNGIIDQLLRNYGFNEEKHCITDRKIKFVKELIREITLKVNIEGEVDLSQKLLSSIQSNDELTKFYDICVREIQKLKKKKFDKSNLTLADVIRTKNVNRLVAYARNQSIVDYLESEYFPLKFIIYGQTIKDHFAPAILRRDLLDHQNIRDFFKFLPRENGARLPHLPATFVNEVFAHLTYEDLENLKKASRFVKV